MKMWQVIEIDKELLSKSIVIFCPECDTPTKHVLSVSKQYYSCGCGTIVEIEIKDADSESAEL